MNIQETNDYTGKQVNRIQIGKNHTVGYILLACNLIGTLQYGSVLLVVLSTGRHYKVSGNDAIALELHKVGHSDQTFITEESYQLMLDELPPRADVQNICYTLRQGEAYKAYIENLTLEGGR